MCFLDYSPPTDFYLIYKLFKSTFIESSVSQKFSFLLLLFHFTNLYQTLAMYQAFYHHVSWKSHLLTAYISLFPCVQLSENGQTAKKLILSPLTTFTKSNVTSFLKYSLLSAFRTSYSYDASFSLNFFFGFFSFICPLRRVGVPLSCVCSSLIQLILFGPS